jgi:TetR/AcrR family transcriptional regulator
MHATTRTTRLGTRGRPEESRAAILNAAVREFAQEGVAGARIEAIARSAGVNKALLYYYFKDKEAIYRAVLDEVFGGVRAAIHTALSQELSPRAKLASYICAHFDYIASNPLYPRIVQAEFLRAGRDPSRLQRIAKEYFRPVFLEISALLEAGAKRGDFRQVDPLHFIPSMISVIVFYFNTAPIMKLMTGSDPMSPARLAERRAAVLDFISAALLVPERAAGKGGASERPK